MDIRVEPDLLGVVVMKDEQNIDPIGTQQIRNHRWIQLSNVQQARTFRPILQVRFYARGNTTNVITVVRFNYRKNGVWVWTWYQPQEFERNAMFYPDVVLNLDSFRQGNHLLGLWGVETSVAFLTKRQLETAPEGRKREFLTTLRYERIARFEWEIIFGIDTRLTPTGELRDPRAQQLWRSNVTVAMDNI